MPRRWVPFVHNQDHIITANGTQQSSGMRQVVLLRQCQRLLAWWFQVVVVSAFNSFNAICVETSTILLGSSPLQSLPGAELLLGNSGYSDFALFRLWVAFQVQRNKGRVYRAYYRWTGRTVPFFNTDMIVAGFAEVLFCNGSAGQTQVRFAIRTNSAILRYPDYAIVGSVSESVLISP